MARTLLGSLLPPIALLALYFVIPFDGSHWIAGAALGIAAALAVLPLTFRRLTRIRTSDFPVREALQAVSMIASLVIVAFAISYYSIADGTNGFPGIHTKLDAIYFTTVTTATVGYGDITPTSQTARAVVTGHILLNITLIGASFRLLSRAASDRRFAEDAAAFHERRRAARRSARGERRQGPAGTPATEVDAVDGVDGTEG
ncbi:MAG: ion channel [Acidimicrobiales bacterium]